MVDTKRYMDWITKSKQDIKSAKTLRDHNCGNDTVAFHAQQAVEKALKGYLLYNGEGVVRGHSLVVICKKAAKYSNDFNKMVKDCAMVNQYYIETRYPAEDPLIVTLEDANECISIAEKILNMVTENIEK